jgi:hypothetical protein
MAEITPPDLPPLGSSEFFEKLYMEKVRQVDVIMDQIIDTQRLIEKSIEYTKQATAGNHQTITYKTDGPGWLLAVGITACCCTWIMIIVVAILGTYEVSRLENSMRDLSAWKDIHQGKITALESKEKAK